MTKGNGLPCKKEQNPGKKRTDGKSCDLSQKKKMRAGAVRQGKKSKKKKRRKEKKPGRAARSRQGLRQQRKKRLAKSREKRE